MTLRILKKYRELSKLAEEHHKIPIISQEKRYLGIILTCVGWLLLAFYTILFEIETERFHVKVKHSLSEVFIEFALLHLVMFLVFFAFSIANGLSTLKWKEPKLLVWRSIFAIIGFWTYSLSRVWTDVVDNSLLYSSDAFWVVILLALLGIRVKLISFIGILIGLGGIVFVYVIDIQSVSDLIGGFFGSVSGFTLAVITVITSYLVKQDPPLRIGLYQSIFGLILSTILAIFFGLVQGWKFPNTLEIGNTIFSGFFFALTLFCIWEAFFYTESYIIGALSYFLPVFTIVIGWVLNREILNYNTIIGTIIITIGGLTVIFDSYLEDRKKKLKHYSDSATVSKK